MLGSNTGRVRKMAGLFCAGLVAIGIAACAASTATKPADPDAAEIADVRVERDGAATTITLMGLEEPLFTAFAEGDPGRVVVDLRAVSPGPLGDPLAVYDGLVEEVSLVALPGSDGEGMTRVEVSLSEAADYDVMPTAEGLVIRVEPMGGEMGMEAEAGEEDPWAITPASLDDAADVPEPVEAPPASRLVGVDAREVGDGSLVHLKADGSVASAETFTLENPDRLVVDLPGLTHAVGRDRIEVASAHAKQVRIGQHADMVRVVIDAGSAPEPFQGRRVVPASSGLVIALGSGADLDMAVEEALGESAAQWAEAPPSDQAQELEMAEEPDGMDDAADPWADDVEMAETEPMPESDEPEMAEAVAPAQDTGASEVTTGGPVTVYGVEFDSQSERDRVVVMGDRPVDYLLFEPSPDTVVLSIQNAEIDPEAAVRIAPEPGGPVSLVTAFAQPDTRTSEVRVVMKRAANLKPEVSRRGSLVVVDFPRDGSVAARPPVMSTSPSGAQLAGVTPSAAAGPMAGTHTVSTPAMAIASGPGAAAPPAAVPAAYDAAAAIDVLQEGGLMDGKAYMGRRISLDFKDIEMADVLRLIAEVSDLNVIAGDEVSGRVTIRLVDVPWDQALDVILLTKGLGFMRVGNVLRIAPADVLKQEEEMRLQERRALEQLEDLVVKLQPVNYADVGQVRGMVQRLLTARGTVDVDTRTNTVIIKDIPSVIDEATALIKAIDTQTPQVLIESRIVEAALDFSREFGVVWGVGVQPLSDAFDENSPLKTNLGGDAFRLNTQGDNNALFSNPLTAAPTALFNITGYLLDEKFNLDLQLQAAEINGDGKVISSPRVVTLDNHKATIEQGVSIPFQTFENGDAQLEFVDAVLKLDVTPHITADKSIIMQVKVSRNAPDDSVFTLTGSPAIAKNQVDTETLVKDGQTLVLGGIYVVQKAKRQSRVPYLHKVPLIGGLFRSDELRDSRKELLIFVTPRIVVTPQAAS
jgi:type IV pilus assembly protein PilQ